jgi:uncharacterized protein (DUF2147 family)
MSLMTGFRRAALRGKPRANDRELGRSTAENQAMRASLLTILAALSLSLIAPGYAAGAEPTAAGLWQALDKDTGQPTGWFLIRDHDGIYEGLIVRMYMKPGESPEVVCDQCTDDRHDKPWLGLDIIRGMKREGLDYTDGTILDPRYGHIYNAMMTLAPDGQTLVVRGYLGISLLGQNQYWTRLPDSAYSEIDPRFNPNHAIAHKPKGAQKPDNSVRR